MSTDLHHVLQRISAVVLNGPQVVPNSLWLLAQASKGADFALACEVPGPVELSQALRTRLRHVDVLPPLLPADPEVPFGAESLVVFYADSTERERGPDREVRLRNRQRDNDRLVTGALFPARRSLPATVALEDAQRALPPDSVLVSIFLGAYPGAGEADGYRISVSTLVLAADDVLSHQYVLDEPEHGTLLMLPDDAPGPAFSCHPIAHFVEPVRRAVLAEPFSRPVTPEAQQLLDAVGEQGLPSLGRLLPKWRAAGKTHICVWPHGPLHFLPFALVAVDGKPLAEDWTVTQISNASFLHRQPSPGVVGDRRLVVVDAAASAGFGLPRIDLSSQVDQIAEHYNAV